jgi:hypothetical protein
MADSVFSTAKADQLAEVAAGLAVACRMLLDVVGPTRIDEANKSDPKTLDALDAVLHGTEALRRAETLIGRAIEVIQCPECEGESGRDCWAARDRCDGRGRVVEPIEATTLRD